MADASSGNVEQLIAQLGSKQATERHGVRMALVGVGSAAVPHLVNALDAPQEHVRWEAAKALVDIADPSTAGRLVQALADESDDVRWVVGEALVALGIDALKPVLKALATSDFSEGVSAGSHHVLHELAHDGEHYSLLEPVLKAFKAPESRTAIPVAADEALKNSGL